VDLGYNKKMGDLFARCEKIGVAKLGKKFMVNN
jgi:hypothetical protein